MQSEAVGGFDEGSDVMIRVSGANTTGQFLLSLAEGIDTLAIAATLLESRDRLSEDFATLDECTAVASLDWDRVTTGQITDDARDLFEAIGLGTPVTAGTVAGDDATNWLDVNATARGYKPGSVVYLTVTSDPIIFGSALVGATGDVQLDGLLPVNALQAGAHSIRIVGTRELGGVSVGTDGNISLSDSTMREIQRFDQGSNAVVQISGQAAGSSHIAVRLIPLIQIVPWWLLWYLIAGLILLLIVRQRKFDKRIPKLVFWSAAIGGVIVVEVFAWIEIAYVMLPWAPIAAGAILGLDFIITRIRHAR